MGKRGFLQISFAWLFAIIIGAIILFFAIYASVRLIGTEEKIAATETGKEIAVLLNPLETGFGEETTTPLSIPVESRINNRCDLFGDFGEQGISVSQKSRGEWTETGIEQVFYNKYIFSNESVEGKNFYLFSKPLNLPFKIADLIFLTSSEDAYCFTGFTDDTEEIQKELKSLGQANLFVENCPSDSVKVCFDTGSNCDIKVDTSQRSVETEDSKVYYETDALMYAAVFSDKDLYECQIERLMKRLETLALIYNDKETILSDVGCSAEVNLLSLADSASSLRDSSDLVIVKATAAAAENSNKRAFRNHCELW